jgi:hypothetical protein
MIGRSLHLKVVSSGVPPSFMIKELVFPWAAAGIQTPRLPGPASSSSPSPPDIILSNSSSAIIRERIQYIRNTTQSAAFLTQPAPRKAQEGLPMLTSLFDTRWLINEEPNVPCMSPAEMHKRPFDGNFFTAKVGGLPMHALLPWTGRL